MENPRTGTFLYTEDLRKMQHKAAFHQGLHCKGKKKIFRQKNTIF